MPIVNFIGFSLVFIGFSLVFHLQCRSMSINVDFNGDFNVNQCRFQSGRDDRALVFALFLALVCRGEAGVKIGCYAHLFDHHARLASPRPSLFGIVNFIGFSLVFHWVFIDISLVCHMQC